MINVYLIPTDLRKIDEGLAFGQIIKGNAKMASRAPLISTNGLEPHSVLHAIAHEIGHLPLLGSEGLTHPLTLLPNGTFYEATKGFPLANVEDDRTRLMWWDVSGDVNPELGRRNARLLSKEWEIIRGTANE